MKYKIDTCYGCNSTGIAKPSTVLGWGICIPDLICRHCLGTGIDPKLIKPIKLNKND